MRIRRGYGNMPNRIQRWNQSSDLRGLSSVCSIATRNGSISFPYCTPEGHAVSHARQSRHSSRCRRTSASAPTGRRSPSASGRSARAGRRSRPPARHTSDTTPCTARSERNRETARSRFPLPDYRAARLHSTTGGTDCYKTGRPSVPDRVGRRKPVAGGRRRRTISVCQGRCGRRRWCVR